MGTLRILYRDVDRAPYLYTLRHCAQQRGLDLEILRAMPGGEWAERLDRGDVDVIGENYWGLVSERARGLPLIAFGSVMNTWNEKLLVHPSIRALADLRGKRFALRTPGPQELFPVMWLRDVGLADQVELVLYNDRDVGRWLQWQKVVDGECHAFFVTYLYADTALAAGLRELPYETAYFEGGNVTFTTSEPIIARKRGDLQDLVHAAFDACHAFKTDRATVLSIMREECVELLREHFTIADDATLERMCQIQCDELADVPIPMAAGIWNAWRMRLDTSPELRAFNPLEMWDFSFAREALAARRR